MEPIKLNDLLQIDENSDDFKYGRTTFNRVLKNKKARN